jgi:large subunit ribosomal protein L17
MLANMVSSLFEHGQIQTTIVKAKEARRVAEKMITLGKKGDLHRRRLAVARMRNKDAVKILFDEIAPKYADRNGGYTRILRLGKRLGDGAEMCILQLVEGTEVKAEAATAPAKVETVEVKAEEVVEKTASEE